MGSGKSAPDDIDCRFNRPQANLHETAKHIHEHADLFRVDVQVAELYEAMLEEIIEVGIPIERNKESKFYQSDWPGYRAPIGRRAMDNFARKRPFVPWCGELIIEGGDEFRGIEQRDWRAYFFDLRHRRNPEIETDEVLLASVRGKRRSKKDKPARKRGGNEQDRHIIESMDKAFEWCAKESPEFELRRRKA